MNAKELLYFLTIMNLVATVGTVVAANGNRAMVTVMALMSFTCYGVMFLMALGMLAHMRS